MLLEILKAEQDFSSVEKSIARFALDHPDELQEMSASDLAAASYTSKASVFRLMKRLGVSGFPEFKSRLLREIDEADRLNHLISDQPFSSETTMQETLRILPAFFESIVYHTALMQNPSKLRKAGSLLQKASCIDIFGVGITQPVGEIAKFKFETIGKVCSFHTGINEHYLHSIKAKNHTALLLSLTGENVLMNQAAKLLNRLEIPSLALTEADSSLSHQVDVCLPVYSKQDVRAMEFMDPLYSMLFLIDQLFVYLHVRSYEEHMKTASEILEEKISENTADR